MTHSTKAIVIKTVQYGETSLIVTMLTELFGLQSYMVNGIRTNKKGNSKAAYFTHGAILEIIAYHQENKNLQRLKEYKFAKLYHSNFSRIVKNSITLFTVELMAKCIKQPETNADLFYFCEDALLHLDELDDAAAANFPLFFMLHFAYFFGFRISDEFTAEDSWLDLQEGVFCSTEPNHIYFLAPAYAQIVADVLKAQQPSELIGLMLNKDTRRYLIAQLEVFYKLHVPEFNYLKTIQVLQEVL